MPTLDFFFDYRSPYSYLAQTQLSGLGAEVRYHPFDILDLMKQVENVPTSITCKPKNRYLAQDLRRWVTRYKVPFSRHPDAGKIDGRRLLRATITAGKDGDVAKAVAAIFKGFWGEPAPLQTAGEIAHTLAAAGFDSARLGAQIDSPELDKALDGATAAAVARGVFGAPTIFVGDEMFFGNDRLEFIRESLARAA